MEKSNNLYEDDRDVPQSIWNQYLKKYKDKYKTFIDEDGCTKIRSKMGEIELYSYLKNMLLFYADFHTKTKKTYFIKKISEEKKLQISQEADTEVCLKFKEEDLESLEEILKLQKRRKLTEEHIQKLILVLQKNREGKNITPQTI